MKREHMSLERRTFDVEIRLTRQDDGPIEIVGHAAVFDKVASGGWFKERVAPGAFARSIQDDDVRALFNHDSNFVLGRNTAGTLELSEDSAGLFTRIIPPDTQYARDLEKSIERRDITGMSIGFEIIKESREAGEDGEPDLFTLEQVKLWDVSPVTFPFYEQTDVSLRSREAWREETHKPQPTSRNIDGKRLQLLQRRFEARRN